jgi:hypothetical protein
MTIRTEIRGLEPHDDLAAAVGERLDAAVADLGLAEDFRSLVICADELPGAHHVWYGIVRTRDSDPRPEVTVYCAPGDFLKSGSTSGSVYPPTAVWEQLAAPHGDTGTGALVFSPAGTDRLLHHHLLMVRDLVRGAVIPETIPATLIQAFEAAWATTVDGRLERAGLPGFSLAERRGMFSRLFSSAGILLPDHWQIFQSLWDGALSEQRDILAVVRQLPRL